MPILEVKDVQKVFDDRKVLDGVNLSVEKGETMVIMGGSGCGKSTLLKHMIGLKEPAKGNVCFNGVDYWNSDPDEQERIMRTFGVLYQSGALWSSMTLAENVSLPLQEYTDLGPKDIRQIASLKLALVGLKGFEDYYPSEISGGMMKRAGLARAMSLDPEILFFDEPSAGLDPISSHLLDELILQIRDSLGTTVVIVTHELPSIFAIGNNSIFLDAEAKTMIASGDPKILLKDCKNKVVHSFLTRGRDSDIMDNKGCNTKEAGTGMEQTI